MRWLVGGPSAQGQADLSSARFPLPLRWPGPFDCDPPTSTAAVPLNEALTWSDTGTTMEWAQWVVIGIVVLALLVIFVGPPDDSL